MIGYIGFLSYTDLWEITQIVIFEQRVDKYDSLVRRTKLKGYIGDD